MTTSADCERVAQRLLATAALLADEAGRIRSLVLPWWQGPASEVYHRRLLRRVEDLRLAEEKCIRAACLFRSLGEQLASRP